MWGKETSTTRSDKHAKAILEAIPKATAKFKEGVWYITYPSKDYRIANDVTERLIQEGHFNELDAKV